MELELELKNRLTEIEKRLEFVRCELDICCKGRLTEEKSGEHIHYIQSINANGKRIRKGISRQPEVIQSLIRRQIFEKEEESLLVEQKMIKKCFEKLKPFDMDNEIAKLRSVCPDLDEKTIFDALYLTADKDWQNESYELSNYKPEMRRHVTSRGLKVRSKSEVLIAEKLYEHNIPFHYEEVLHFDSITLIPDFTIRRSDGKLFIWEHEGMTNVQEYIEWQNHKGRLYASKGIVPWDNLIVTYDNAAGIIDLRIIESEIQNKLII